MSDQTAEAADKDPTTQGELARSDDEEPPEEGADQQGNQGSDKREHLNIRPRPRDPIETGQVRDKRKGKKGRGPSSKRGIDPN